jgi:hypothetical protein
LPEKTFEVPWGSESICFWCKKNGKCSLYKEDPELSFTRKVRGQLVRPGEVLPTTGDWYELQEQKMRFTELMKGGSLRGCPINEFDPDETKLPENFKGYKIIVRGCTA